MTKTNKQAGSWLGRLASKDIRLEKGQIELVDESPEQQTSHASRRHLALFILPTLLLVIMAWVLASIFLPKVRLGDHLVSAHQSDQALSHILQNQSSQYQLSLSYPDGSQKSYSLAEVGLKIDVNASLRSLRQKQHQFASRLEWWHANTAYVQISSDSIRLNKFIDQHATIIVQPAKDATLTLSHGKIQLTDATVGKHYGLDNPVASLLAAASSLSSHPLKLKTLSTQPAIAATQLAQYQTKLQNMLAQNISFSIDGKKIQATSADIAEWIELTPVKSGKAIDITVNSGKVLAYINKISAASVHPPKAQIEVTQADGSTSVLVKGISGTDVVNEAAAATEVAQKVLAGKGAQKDLVVSYAAFKTISAQAYPKWIEVDLSNKRMYAYEQDSLARTFLISAGAPKTPTVTGQYAIYSKLSQQDMRGRNVDGSNYFQPKVPWVNYFYKDYAIHGNYWRPLSYFGNINSSHGCVGIVVSDAQWMYSWAPIGTPVIVHT